MTAYVEEGFFGMGKKKLKQKPSSQSRPLPTTTAALNPAMNATTAKDIITQQMQEVKWSDQFIQLFGNRGYNWEHDGNTIKTTASALNNDSLDNTTEANNMPRAQAQINLTGMEVDNSITKKTDNDSASIATRIKLTSVTKQNEALAGENENQAAEMESMETVKANLEARLAAI